MKIKIGFVPEAIKREFHGQHVALHRALSDLAYKKASDIVDVLNDTIGRCHYEIRKVFENDGTYIYANVIFPIRDHEYTAQAFVEDRGIFGRFGVFVNFNLAGRFEVKVGQTVTAENGASFMYDGSGWVLTGSV